MAASDGSLHFDTTLDTEGFEKGSQKMKDAISNLKDAVDDLGNSAKDAAALQTAQEEASRLTATLEQMAEAQQDLAIADLNPEQYQELQNALQQVAEQARAAREALEQVTNNNASNNPEYNAVHQQLNAFLIILVDVFQCLGKCLLGFVQAPYISQGNSIHVIKPAIFRRNLLQLLVDLVRLCQVVQMEEAVCLYH